MRGLFICVMMAICVSVAPPGQAQERDATDGRISFYQHVAWSDDGQLLATSVMTIARAAWEREQFRALQDGQFDVQVIPLDGSPPLLTGDAATNDMWATWWPGHRCILYSAEQRDGTSVLHFIQADGADRRPVRGSPRPISQASVSPDGTRVAFVSREGVERHIFVVNADSTAERQLTNDDSNNMFPSWSADGRRIVFTSDRDGRGREGIFVMNADGSDVTRLVPGMRAGFARWSPDGKRLAIIAGDLPDTHIYIAGADGSNPVRLTR